MSCNADWWHMFEQLASTSSCADNLSAKATKSNTFYSALDIGAYPASEKSARLLQIATRVADNPKTPDAFPLISVIMTVFNCTKYLLFAARSILTASWPNIELIIVDDASDPAHADAMEAVFAQLHRDAEAHPWARTVVTWRNANNTGTYVSKNTGILLARGSWLAFQDSDDVSLCDRLTIQYLVCRGGPALNRLSVSDAEWLNAHVLRPLQPVPRAFARMHNNNKTINSCSGFVACYVGFMRRPVRCAESQGRQRLGLAPAEISLFADASVFRAVIGFHEPVRVAADTELKERMGALKLATAYLPMYLYACLDKWADPITARPESLTSGSNNAQVILGPQGNRVRGAYMDCVAERIRSGKSILPSAFCECFAETTALHGRLLSDKTGGVHAIQQLFPNKNAIHENYRAIAQYIRKQYPV